MNPAHSANLLGLSGSSHTKGYSSSAEDKYRQQSYATHQRSASFQPQLVYSAQPTTTSVARPSLPHQPASFMATPHGTNRYAYVTTTGTGGAPAANMMMVAATPQGYIATSNGMARVQTTSYPAVQRIRQDAGVTNMAGHGAPPHHSRSASSDSAVRYRQAGHTAPKVTTPYIARRAIPAVDSEGSDAETYANTTANTDSGYGMPITSVPRIISHTTGASLAPSRPSMRKRTTSSASAASVHFNPDNLFLTFPSPHTIKLSNIPRFGAQALVRAIREKVVTMWLPGVTFQKEGRGELIVGFAGLADGSQRQGAQDLGLSETERRSWGLWTARGAEGISALRLLTALFSTFASQGFSYLASLHSLPPQVIFSTTPSDEHSRFLAIEISIAPLHHKKTKVPVTDPDSGELILTKKVKIDMSHISIRCVDLPDDVLRAVVGAVRNTGRDGAGINHTKRKSGSTTDNESNRDSKSSGHHREASSELLEFGVQGERWDMKGVYVLDSVISRGTGKRAVSRKEISRSRAEKQAHPNMPQVIEADTDTLPVLLGHILKALSSHGYRLESSIPLPLPVPLVDPFSPFGNHSQNGFSSFLTGVLGGDDSANARKGHGREVWMFRSVGWFEDEE